MKPTIPLILRGVSVIAIGLAGGLAGWLLLSRSSPSVSQALTNPHCSNFDCYSTYYAELTTTQTPEQALSDLKQRYQLEPLVKSECHQLIHSIGRAARRKYATIGEAYQHGDYFCWSGYFHGVMEQTLSEASADAIEPLLNTACTDIPGKKTYSFDYYNCVHGLGHGVMYINDNELFTALNLCDKINGNWEQSSCWSGVFMENVIADNRNHFTDYLKEDEPLYPCTAVNDRQKLPCYLMQTSYMLKINNYDFTKVFALCEQADPGFINTCYQSLGRDASGQSISNVARTRATCLLGSPGDQQAHCVIGAVKDFISYYHSDQEAYQLCDSLPAELQATCKETTISYYKNF